MTGHAAPILWALLIQLALGLAVFFTNPRRKANQSFLVLCVTIIAWLTCLYIGSTSRTLLVIAACMRGSFIAAALILLGLNFLRLAIREPNAAWRQLISCSRLSLVSTAMIVCLSGTRLIVQGARFGDRLGSAPQPIYNQIGVWFFAVYFTAALFLLVTSSFYDFNAASGSVKSELGYLLLGSASILVLTLGAYQVLRFFVDASKLFWFAPLRVVLFSFAVAYGIATRKLMEVGFFLRRLMSYVVLTAYLLLLYLAVWSLVLSATASVFHSRTYTTAHVIAALVVAFAMAPARGVSQSLADRLFVGTRGLDFRTTVSKAAAILESITTLPDLLGRFASTIGEAVGTDNVNIYLASRKGDFVRHYPANGTQLPGEGPLAQWLQRHREPLVLDELHRIRATPPIVRVRERLEELSAAAALGIFAREHLVGIMLLGPRLSGRIYGRMEQDALQVLCGQLAVAIDNAELFTEVQNAKIYNEILLENLTTGVIAADADGSITVFNQEAERITGLDPDAFGRTIDDLPPALGSILRLTLDSGQRQEDREIYLRTEAGNIFARASSSTFRGHEGELLGALMVVTDITALKRLELQIRRSDRLASLGTLSAGMAHEIKNPLVSIKTFAQLLPERYHESDFRETFSTLIVHEINRIDSLVNQLLRFARPAKPLLSPMHVHEVLEKTLLLVQHRLYQKEIKLTRFWGAEIDTIRADSDQLEQVFLNFFLNAMDAMKRGGELTVATEIRSGDALVSDISVNGEDAREALCISIRDTGQGIKPEDIPHVFDPFFTTKDYGTGLGLSVVHGIVGEHGGQIEVESEPSNGTTFHIFLPLVRFREEVAVA